jgi:hypothetical protein
MAIQHISQLRWVICRTGRRNGLKDVKAPMETAGTPIHISPDLLGLDTELKKRPVP